MVEGGVQCSTHGTSVAQLCLPKPSRDRPLLLWCCFGHVTLQVTEQSPVLSLAVAGIVITFERQDSEPPVPADADTVDQLADQPTNNPFNEAQSPDGAALSTEPPASPSPVKHANLGNDESNNQAGPAQSPPPITASDVLSSLGPPPLQLPPDVNPILVFGSSSDSVDNVAEAEEAEEAKDGDSDLVQMEEEDNFNSNDSDLVHVDEDNERGEAAPKLASNRPADRVRDAKRRRLVGRTASPTSPTSPSKRRAPTPQKAALATVGDDANSSAPTIADCKWGAKCRTATAHHAKRFAHPPGWDAMKLTKSSTSADSDPAEEVDPDSTKPICKYHPNCYRTNSNPQHNRDYRHPPGMPPAPVAVDGVGARVDDNCNSDDGAAGASVSDTSAPSGSRSTQKSDWRMPPRKKTGKKNWDSFGFNGTTDWNTAAAEWQERKKALSFVHERGGRESNLTYGATAFMSNIGNGNTTSMFDPHVAENIYRHYTDIDDTVNRLVPTNSRALPRDRVGWPW